MNKNNVMAKELELTDFFAEFILKYKHHVEMPDKNLAIGNLDKVFQILLTHQDDSRRLNQYIQDKDAKIEELQSKLDDEHLKLDKLEEQIRDLLEIPFKSRLGEEAYRRLGADEALHTILDIIKDIRKQ